MEWQRLIEKYDKSNMLWWSRHFAQQCIEAIYLGKKCRLQKRKIENIVACGMGGSGIGGEVIRNVVKEDSKIPFEVYHSYELPEYVGRNTLVFIVSYSGNTEETIACYKQAKKKRAYVVVITSNGKLKRWERNAIIVPGNFPQPRMAIAYTSLPMLVILQRLGIVPKKSRQLNDMIYLLMRRRESAEEKARNLALKLKGKLPVIYAPEELAAAAYKWRCDINENAKQFAFHHVISEQNHNEINAYRALRNAEFILFRSGSEDAKMRKRMEITKSIVKRHFTVNEVRIEGSSLLARTYYAVYLGYLFAYYTALLNKLNPTPVPTIAGLKKRLKR